MATMVRTRAATVSGAGDLVEDALEAEEEEEDIKEGVPAPFPLGEMEQEKLAEEVSVQQMSIQRVQRACILTLNNLLSPSPHQQSLSMATATTTQWEPITDTSTCSPLTILLSNLRMSSSSTSMRQIDPSAPYQELKLHVSERMLDARKRDRELAESLVSVLARLERLSQQPELVASASTSTLTTTLPPREEVQEDGIHAVDMYTTLSRQVADLQLHRPTENAAGTGAGGSGIKLKPVEKVERALLWNGIEIDLDNILRLCSQSQQIEDREDGRSLSLPPGYEDSDLPKYEYEYDDDDDDEYGYSLERTDTKAKLLPPRTEYDSTTTSAAAVNEKMIVDLDRLSSAVERFYQVTPQLHDQRASLRQKSSSSKTKPPSSSTPPPPSSEEQFVDLILRSSSRRLNSQSFVPASHDILRRREREKEREKQREMEIKYILERTGEGRISGQDAVVRAKSSDGLVHVNGAERDPEEMISLPDFIREPLPTTPLPPSASTKGKSNLRGVMMGRSRSLSAPGLAWLASVSASVVRTPSPMEKEGKEKGKEKDKDKVPSQHQSLTNLVYLAEHQESIGSIVIFVHMPSSTSTFSATTTTTAELEAEILPTPSSSSSSPSLPMSANSNTNILIRDLSGEFGHESHSFPLPCSLPSKTQVEVGKYKMNKLQGYWELKLRTTTSATSNNDTIRREEEAAEGGEERKHQDSSSTSIGGTPTPILLTATQLTSLSSSSPSCTLTFHCSSCSLPILRLLSNSTTYLDLPSEHWAELVDAWICHPDEKNKYVAGLGDGTIWPADERKVLVGNGYLMVREKGGVVVGNLTSEGDAVLDGGWTTTRCLCGAVLGRSCLVKHNPNSKPKSEEAATVEGEEKEKEWTCYKLTKWAFKLVCPGIEPIKLNTYLPAFVVQDMHALATAHANWRFIVCDEEEGRPRFLIWLFRPNIRIAWSSSSAHSRRLLLPSRANQPSAKVLFKLLEPNTVVDAELTRVLAKYPGFNRAERISYPRDACRRLAALLRESHRMYPETMGRILELDIGWLQRGVGGS